MKSAKIIFKRLFNSRGHIPPLIGDFIKKLSKVFDKTINHLANNRIPSTNNKKERHFGITLPGYLKRRFKTDLGLENALKIRRIPMDPKKQKKNQ